MSDPDDRSPSPLPPDLPRRNGRILVVDDNDITASVVARHLRHAGLIVECAGTGADALRLAGEFRPDLILLDVNLPDIPGTEVCRRLKADSELAAIFVVYLSAERTQSQHRVAGLNTGADGYLTHPIPPIELLAQVGSLLRLKRAEDALRESRDLYRTLVDEAPIGIAHIALDGVVVAVNRHLAAMLGTEPAQLTGRSFDDFIHPDQRDAVRNGISALLRGERRPRRMHLHLIAANNSSVWAGVVAYLQRDRAGVPRQLFVAVEDVTAQRAAELALLERDTLLEELNERSHDWIVGVDASGVITHVNTACVRAMRLRAEELIGRPLAEFVAPESAPPWQSALERVLQTAGDEVIRLQLAAAGGTLHLEGSIGRRDFGGGPAVRAVLRDVTERRRLEEQLLRAQRMESIGTLTGGIAHDLNNVLAPILLCIGLVRSAHGDKERAEFLDVIEKSTQRAAALVRQVLAFGRGVEGEKIPLQIRIVAKEVVAILRETFPKNVRVINNTPDDLWLVHGNPTQLIQVVLNLCINARDAMPDGGVLEIGGRNAVVTPEEVTHHTGRHPGRYVVLSIADSGAGIPPELHQRIFEPFFTTKRPGQGTGLGLATVASIVRAHDGFVSLESTVGRGTTFSVYLPMHDTQAGLTRPSATTPVPRGAGELVLVVDDERPVRAMMERTLRDGGYRVVTAGDGVDAVARFMSFGPEIKLVITDIVMPRLDGRGVVRAIRKSYPNTKILAISGNAPPELTADPAACGLDGFVPKPFAGDELLRAVRVLLDKSGDDRPAEPAIPSA